ncbi:MAG: hypothetical protein ACYDAO_10715 [Thermoplasmataceae archaeon]
MSEKDMSIGRAVDGLCKNEHPLHVDENRGIRGCNTVGCEYSIDAIEKLVREKKGIISIKEESLHQTKMETPQQIVINSSPPKVELSTNAKGQHQWTISKYGEDLNEVLKEITAIDDLFMEKYKAERGSA